MAFDAKNAVAERLTSLTDQLNQAKATEAADARRNADEVARIQEEIDSWNALLAEPEPAPADVKAEDKAQDDKPKADSKTTSKK